MAAIATVITIKQVVRQRVPVENGLRQELRKKALVSQPREPRPVGYSTPKTVIDTRDVKTIECWSRLNNNGHLAFKALARDGVSRVFTGDARGKPVAVSGTENLEFVSSLDINDSDIVFGAGYGKGNTYTLGKDGKPKMVPAARYTGLNTMSNPIPTRSGGLVYKSDFRIEIIGNDGRRTTIATQGSAPGMFKELGDEVVVDLSGDVIFYGIPPGRGQGYSIFRHHNGGLVDLLADRPPYAQIHEICGSDNGQVVIHYENDGTEGVDLLSRGRIVTVADTKSGYEKVFPAFLVGGVNAKGTVVFIATPKGGSKGIFVSTDPTKIIQVGDALTGAKITDLGLASDAINRNGAIVFRATLGDGRIGIYVTSATGSD